MSPGTLQDYLIKEYFMPRIAKARMVHNSICRSETVNRLDTKAALLFTWLLTAVDDQGRMLAKPSYVKAIVVPMREDFTIQDIKTSLLAMEDAGLIKMYKAKDDELLLQVMTWYDYQRLKSPRSSKYEAPSGWEDRTGMQTRDSSGRFQDRIEQT
jgi:hypothetical protein